MEYVKSAIKKNGKEEDIKTILTKEQYLDNCYEVGGKMKGADNIE